MAVAHDFASESHTGTTGSASEASFTWSHNPVGTPRGVIVFVMNLSAAANIVSSVTYDGTALTALTGVYNPADVAGEPGSALVFFLGTAVPTTDPATVVVNRTNNANVLYAVCVTVTAGGNTEITGGVALQGDGTLAEQSVDDGSPGTNSVRYAGGFSGLDAVPGAGASSTALHSIDTGTVTAAVVRETTAGQGARSVGFSSGSSDDRAITHFAVKEAAALSRSFGVILG